MLHSHVICRNSDLVTKTALENVIPATDLFRSAANRGRLKILCILATGEKTVTELAGLLSIRQPTVSQQLVRLKFEGLVESRRDGRNIYYSVKDKRVLQLIDLVFEMYR